MQALLAQLDAMTAWELVAVLLAIAYLMLAVRESLWCWPAAFASTLIYTIIFWRVALLMESALNVYYMGMAVYGFWQWRWGGGGNGVAIRVWPWKTHATIVTGTGLVSLVAGWLMATQTSADWPFLDAATTCYAVAATILVARKELLNWVYWIVIDSVSIFLYLDKGLLLTAALFLLYIGLAILGYADWRRAWRQQTPASVVQAHVA
jgi:nicotinamide mononucleotide transporter